MEIRRLSSPIINIDITNHYNCRLKKHAAEKEKKVGNSSLKISHDVCVKINIIKENKMNKCIRQYTASVFAFAYFANRL